MGHNWGPTYATYHRLKVRGVVDYLAGLIVGAAGLDPESDDAFAVHYLVRAWKDGRYVEAPRGRGVGRPSEHKPVPARLRPAVPGSAV